MAKILILDIETAPAEVYAWGLYDQTIGINQIKQKSYVLCWSAKWLDNKEIMSDCLINYPSTFKRDRTNDKKVAESIWKLLDEADIVIGHNSNNFDLKWLNTIFLRNGIKPPSTYQTIDTYRQLKANFRFLSNKLEFSSRELGIGHKIKHEGFDLWIKCMRGELKPFARMVKYCKHDVELCEELYKEIRPFIKNHPNLVLYENNTEMQCPNCGSKNFKKKGFSYTRASKFQRFICREKNCGTSFRGRENLISKDNKKKIPA